MSLGTPLGSSAWRPLWGEAETKSKRGYGVCGPYSLVNMILTGYVYIGASPPMLTLWSIWKKQHAAVKTSVPEARDLGSGLTPPAASHSSVFLHEKGGVCVCVWGGGSK